MTAPVSAALVIVAWMPLAVGAVPSPMAPCCVMDSAPLPAPEIWASMPSMPPSMVPVEAVVIEMPPPLPLKALMPAPLSWMAPVMPPLSPPMVSWPPCAEAVMPVPTPNVAVIEPVESTLTEPEPVVVARIPEELSPAVMSAALDTTTLLMLAELSISASMPSAVCDAPPTTIAPVPVTTFAPTSPVFTVPAPAL